LPARQVDYALAAASGALLALSFPRFGTPVLAWVGLAPLLAALATPGLSPAPPAAVRGLGHALVLGLIAGCVYFAGTIYWVGGVMTLYGGVSPWAAWPVAAALVAYMALYPALFAVVTRRLVQAFGPVALLASPFVWVATEFGRTHLFGGFPWVLLGYSQTTVTPVAQAASLFGVFGLSGLVAAVNAAAVVAILPRCGRWRLVAPVTVGVVLASAALWGRARVARGDLTRGGTSVRIGLVQGDVDQAEKWDPARAASIFDEYLQLTRQAIGAGARLVLWPESSTPFSFDEDPIDASRVRQIARESGAAILVGSNQVVRRDDQTKYYNAAYLVQPDGRVGGIYEKMHLVPFGEYVPLKHLLFFAAPLVQAVSDFSPGEKAVLLKADGHLFSTAICYEIVYPSLVRRFVVEGSELLTTITNDAWFGRTSAPYQHFEQASMRAIEDGRYLIRSANTGISGIVDPYGRVLQESRLFEPAVVTGDVRFLTDSTFYARHGDVFAYASVALALALLLAGARRRL
jgi:apolipoprotein N-acyltransferase